jgi:sigma-B regulation protein RsbU (phosphoserine phosphatase)
LALGEVLILEEQVLGMLRGQIGGIALGTIFLFIGLASCASAAIRGRGQLRILVWFGIFNAMYGVRILAQSPPVFHAFPRIFGKDSSYFIAAVTYLIIIPALFFWLELSVGKLRPVLRITIAVAVASGILGVGSIFFTKSPFAFLPLNNALAIWALLVVGVVNAVPSLARKSFLVQSRISTIGTLVLAVAVLYSNLKEFFKLPNFPYFEPMAFAVFVFSLGYMAAERIFSDQRRLLSIEKELAIAREIQTSILPSSVPELANLRISAAYRPMTEVAGDFYEFIPVDQSHAGFLIADVSGHGVPAALIAAMIKVAMQSVMSCADEPAEVMRRLNEILSSQLRCQFVTAAYLWLDTSSQKALYSAAGHPPLLFWRDGRMERVESNGLLFGVMPNASYPVCELSFHAGDRFLLYTDGVTEPENMAGVPFGEQRLEQIVQSNVSRPAAELSEVLLGDLRTWQQGSASEQDDITLLVIDVVETPCETRIPVPQAAAFA